jgi:hypothetical protein
LDWQKQGRGGKNSKTNHKSDAGKGIEKETNSAGGNNTICNIIKSILQLEGRASSRSQHNPSGQVFEEVERRWRCADNGNAD